MLTIKWNFAFLLVTIALVMTMSTAWGSSSGAAKPNPDKVLDMLKAGNQRFATGKGQRPHADAKRLQQAGSENQGNHAYATVITCSDSRVPVEILFDAGIMDIFVIRVAGNVVGTDEAGSIEYGLAHVRTPVLVILGHTQCGAVTAVAQQLQGKKLTLERNIPPLVGKITPAVKRTMALHPHLKGSELIPLSIEENVWEGIHSLFMTSPATRNLVKSHKVKVAPAIYEVGTGLVRWLPQEKVAEILKKVEADSKRAMNPFAETSGKTE